jgi:enamine deaminase RidA (YjgF/YER057c/UK114 family)
VRSNARSRAKFAPLRRVQAANGNRLAAGEEAACCSKECAMPIERFHENELMSKYVIANNTVYMSGQVADDKALDFEGQLAQILAKIDRQLAEIGIDKRHLLSVTVWLDDYTKWSRLNVLWKEWIPQGHKPARNCVESKLAAPEYQIEIAIIASMTL